MVHRCLLISSVFIAAAFGFADRAKAQVSEITTFTATISASCNISAPTTGSLTGQLATNSAKTEFTTSIPARVNVSCTGGNLRVDNPVANPSNPTQTASSQAFITTAANNSTNSATTPLTLVAGDVGDAEVRMEATAAAPGTFAVGNYSYTVMVTATP